MEKQKYKPTERDYQIEIPDNSYVAKILISQHPRVIAFEKRYENINWRARLR